MAPLPSLVSLGSNAATAARQRVLPGGRQTLRLHWVPAALTLIIVGGASARLLGVSWGLPLEFHPDEWVVVDGAIDMAKRHSFEPGFFFRPDHVEMQLSNLAYLTYAHLFHGSSPQRLYAVSPAPFIMISRTVTVCFGVAMIVVANLIGKRFTRPIGIMSAFLVAFFPLFITESHFATPDVPLSLALMVVILGCMRYLDSPSWGNLLLACVGVSVAVAIKYPGALGAIMIAITVITSAIRAQAWRRLLVHGTAAVAAVMGFLFAISPVLFTNFHEVTSQLTAQAGDTHIGADGLGWSGNMGFYATTFANSVGIILLVSFALGAAWSVRLRLVQSLPLWLGAIYWVILSRLPLHWSRWGLPMYLTPLLLAPIGVYYTFRFLRDSNAGRWLRWGAVGLGALMATNLVAGSVAATASYSAPDTRTVAKEDLAARGVNKANAVFEGYTPLSPGIAQLVFPAFTVVNGRLELNKDHANSGVRYLVLSSLLYGRYDADPQYVTQRRFYSLVNEQFSRLATYDPATPGSPTVLEVTNIWNVATYVGQVAHGALSGPTIKLYEIGDGRG